jgi:hypothetical protein
VTRDGRIFLVPVKGYFLDVDHILMEPFWCEGSTRRSLLTESFDKWCD